MRRLTVLRAGSRSLIDRRSNISAFIPIRTFASKSKAKDNNKDSIKTANTPTPTATTDNNNTTTNPIASSSTVPPSSSSSNSSAARFRLASDLLSKTRDARLTQAQASAANSSSSISSSSRPRLDIPLDPRHDFIDPVIAARVKLLTPDDILANELTDLQAKLVATPRELQRKLQEEREADRDARAAMRRFRSSRPSRVSSSANGKYLDEIDIDDEHESLILDNPESMRRQGAIELKQVRQSVRDRILDLDDKFDSQLDIQATEAEKERKDRESRLEAYEKLIQSGDAGKIDLEKFNKRPDSREAEAREAEEFVKMRENVIHQYRADFGERVGDDYFINEEENLFEPPDQPTQPKQRKPNQTAELRPKKIDQYGRSAGSGGRKSSKANCWIKPGTGQIFINHRNIANYFERLTHRGQIIRPMIVTNTTGLYDIFAFCNGGGKTGQSGAIQLAVARALANQEPNLRERLKKSGLLTRDARKVERKKPGKFKARKGYTYVRR